MHMSAEPKRNQAMNKTCYEADFDRFMGTPDMAHRTQFEREANPCMSMIDSGEFHKVPSLDFKYSNVFQG